MPLTAVGAVYATNSKLLQRIYIPHGDDGEIDKQHVGPGESLMRVSLALYRAGGPPAVQEAVGIPTFSGRCVVVDQDSNVVNVIIADPDIYTPPVGQVIAHDLATVGDVWDGSDFTRMYAVVDMATGNILSIEPRSIEPVVRRGDETTILIEPPPGAIIGQNIIDPAKLAGL